MDDLLRTSSMLIADARRTADAARLRRAHRRVGQPPGVFPFNESVLNFNGPRGALGEVVEGAEPGLAVVVGADVDDRALLERGARYVLHRLFSEETAGRSS